MKTNTLTTLVKLLMLLFVTTIGNSQTTILPLQELTIVPECGIADPNANCTAESFKVLGAFLEDVWNIFVKFSVNFGRLWR